MKYLACMLKACPTCADRRERGELIERPLAVAPRLKELASARQVLIAYLRSKADTSDWHAVSDAANDLRELDVETKVVRELKGEEG